MMTGDYDEAFGLMLQLLYYTLPGTELLKQAATMQLPAKLAELTKRPQTTNAPQLLKDCTLAWQTSARNRPRSVKVTLTPIGRLGHADDFSALRRKFAYLADLLYPAR